jgi:squalene-associated FAD-dependent desaturase
VANLAARAAADDRRAMTGPIAGSTTAASSSGTRIAIVGGGWSGLACALALRDRGAQIDLFEASPRWGGRARSAPVRLDGRTIELDAGQHLMIGAYRECLALLGELGHDRPPALHRQRLALAAPAGFALRRRRLPGGAGLAAGLLLARGLSLASRWAALRMMVGLRARGWRPATDATTVAAMLAEWRQPEELVRALWEPLCVGALNTPIDVACAATFAAVLRDTLGGRPAATDLLLPSATLAALVADPALERLRAAGVGIHRSRPIAALRPHPDGGWALETAPHRAAIRTRYDHVVVATDAHAAAALLETANAGLAARLRGFAFAPIATVYLGWRAEVALPAVGMLDEDRGAGCPGQWLFDRGRHAGLRVGAVVVSARDRVDDLDNDALRAAVRKQVVAQLGLPEPVDSRTVSERRATWRCTPARPRVAIDAAAPECPGLWLAGDYLEADYPSTLESAVRSGRRVAAAIASIESLATARNNVSC